MPATILDGTKIAQDAIAANAGIGAEILAEANQQAQEWLRERVMRHLPQTTLAPAPVVIDFDQAGTMFCASSSRLTWQIHWTLQPFPHSLYGAMVVPRVLEHEYISHLLPPNRSLSNGVREVFLVEMLEEEHRNDDHASPRDAAADVKLAAWFRFKLEQHFQRNGLTNRAELRDFEEVAVRLRRKSRPDFWKMTAEILLLPDGDLESQIVDRALKRLRVSADSTVDRVTVPWKGFGYASTVFAAIDRKL